LKPGKKPAKAHVTRTPLDLQQFPLHAQTDVTPDRHTVREMAHPVTAPRQSRRRSERAK